MSYSADLNTQSIQDPYWISSNIVNEWDSKKGLLNVDNQKPREVVKCNCSIISPTYQSRIVENYNNVPKRQQARLDLAHIEKVRHERAIIQNKDRVHPSLFGRVDKEPQVNVYVTDSEYNLPGTLDVTKSRLPKLKELQKIRQEPVKAGSRTKEKQRILNLFKYEAYIGLKNTLQFLWETFKIKSYDNRATDIKCTVDTVNDDGDPDTNNAFWNGRQMYIGMGDQDIFSRFSIDQDILAHEFGHAVVQAICDLEYAGQSGAINEHFADVIGILVKQFFGGVATRHTFEAAFDPAKRTPQTAEAGNYKIGEEVLIDKGGIFALRDMENPGSAFKGHPILGDDEQPSHFGDYIKLPFNVDNGGVHKYSGFLNRAFVITAKLLGGYAWENAGQIWFEALKHLTPTATFKDLVNETINAAKAGKEKDAVLKAWTVVGLL